MNVLLLMIPSTLLLALGFVAAYLWAVGSGQMDDLVTPAHRALLDHEHLLDHEQHHGDDQPRKDEA